ncbi:MAG: XdhC family protein, partial [Litoreibacter sp.]|nr:XdhC family protein [Litoreibacter sp.]
LVTEVLDASAMPEGDAFARRVEGDGEMPLKVSRALADARNGNMSSELIFDGGWLVEPLSQARVPLWIYGAGHVGRALIDVLCPLPDFEITWVDTGLERFPESVPAGVRILPATNPAEAVALASKDAFHLVLTYSHALDLELCHRLISHGFAEAGL